MSNQSAGASDAIPSGEAIVTTVRDYLMKEFGERRAEIEQLTIDASLFDRGLIDSLSFLALVTFLEKQFQISVPPADFTPQNFASLEAITGYVRPRLRPPR